MRVMILIAALTAGSASAAAPDPAAVATLELSELFVRPVGPRGLELTAKARQLDGQRVSIAGYMVREEEPVPGHFMLAPVPTSLAEVADGPADYLPGATVFVELPPDHASENLAFRPGFWQLEGTLALGAHAEPNGRVAYVRLLLDDSAISLLDRAGQVGSARDTRPALR